MWEWQIRCTGEKYTLLKFQISNGNDTTNQPTNQPLIFRKAYLLLECRSASSTCSRNWCVLTLGHIIPILICSFIHLKKKKIIKFLNISKDRLTSLSKSKEKLAVYWPPKPTRWCSAWLFYTTSAILFCLYNKRRSICSWQDAQLSSVKAGLTWETPFLCILISSTAKTGFLISIQILLFHSCHLNPLPRLMLHYWAINPKQHKVVYIYTTFSSEEKIKGAMLVKLVKICEDIISCYL